jgi:hypothetical protein
VPAAPKLARSGVAAYERPSGRLVSCRRTGWSARGELGATGPSLTGVAAKPEAVGPRGPGGREAATKLGGRLAREVRRGSPGRGREGLLGQQVPESGRPRQGRAGPGGCHRGSPRLPAVPGRARRAASGAAGAPRPGDPSRTESAADRGTPCRDRDVSPASFAARRGEAPPDCSAPPEAGRDRCVRRGGPAAPRRSREERTSPAARISAARGMLAGDRDAGPPRKPQGGLSRRDAAGHAHPGEEPRTADQERRPAPDVGHDPPRPGARRARQAPTAARQRRKPPPVVEGARGPRASPPPPPRVQSAKLMVATARAVLSSPKGWGGTGAPARPGIKVASPACSVTLPRGVLTSTSPSSTSTV